ncbi:MAG TPA: magnesium chelatase [Gemmatimonadales bacterium]|jgi:magnesium chelatase subunit I|nr:magnesium chelatase [Gemmatimonadales bacterium]
MTTRPRTLGALKASPWGQPPLAGRSIRDEIRTNLLRQMAAGRPLFPGVLGFDDTIVPELVNALLARHDFILLGTRGQAKTRLLRGLTGFLDEVIPVVAGSEINDDPFAPISRYARQRLDELGDDTPIDWVTAEQRYVEKLATPDVTIADMIGDLDPIKAARGGHVLGDELTMHFGLLPRANRGIFAINELPDLSGKIQVGLFNIMQEGDVQIKGYPVRLPLDVLLVFTANPEDYTARGKIITPLKDRIGSEIRTHYPRTVSQGMAITAQEAWVDRGVDRVVIPDFISELVEEVAFAARDDKRVDRRAGVSQRLPISLIEVVASNAERRAVVSGEKQTVARVSDVYAGMPAITGKLELEYEGELQGSDTIARELIRRAAGSVVDNLPEVDDSGLDAVVAWFDQGGALKVGTDERTDTCWRAFKVIPGMLELVERMGLAPADDHGRAVSACELVLEALAAEQRITRNDEFGWQRVKPQRRKQPGHGESEGFSI